MTAAPPPLPAHPGTSAGRGTADAAGPAAARRAPARRGPGGTAPARSGAGRLAAGRCVLVTVDVQNDFCHPDGTMARRGLDVAPARAAARHVERLVAAARAAGVPVVHVRTDHDDDVDSSAWVRRFSPAHAVDPEPAPPNCVTGSWGARFYLLRPQEGEPVVVKHRYSGFSAPELAAVLSATGRDSLVLAGVATNVCVDSTARAAVDLDWYATVVSDASAAYVAHEHEAALDTFAAHFGAVVGTEEVLVAWAGTPTGTDDATEPADDAPADLPEEVVP